MYSRRENKSHKSNREAHAKFSEIAYLTLFMLFQLSKGNNVARMDFFNCKLLQFAIARSLSFKL